MGRTLRTQGEWCARAQLVLGVGLIVLLGGFVAFVYRPNSSKLKGMQEQIADKRRDLTSNRLERFDKKLPKAPELGPFINDITEVSHQTALRKWTVEPGVPARNDLY